MNQTLLSVVQEYLDYTDGFPVNSIFDTDESQQVATLAEKVFYRMLSWYRDVEYTQDIRTLDAVSDTERPNYLRIPDAVHRIQDSQVYYNVANPDNGEVLSYKKLQYLTPQEFLDLTAQKAVKTTTEDYIVVEDFNRTKFPVATNKQPDFYTSFDGEYVIFDSFYSDVDTTMQESKTRVFVSGFPVFLQQDDFVIDLPWEAFTYYKDMVLEECYQALRQELPPLTVSKSAKEGRLKMQQESRRMGSAGRKQSFRRRTYYGVQTRKNSRW